MEWPDYFPTGCPPADAANVSGPFFRLVRDDPPRGEDFKTNWDLGREYGPPCLRHGLSGFLTLDDATQARAVIPGFRRRRIARGALTPDLGKLKHTPTKTSNGHHTWWVPEGIIRVEQYFAVV